MEITTKQLSQSNVVRLNTIYEVSAEYPSQVGLHCHTVWCLLSPHKMQFLYMIPNRVGHFVWSLECIMLLSLILAGKCWGGVDARQASQALTGLNKMLTFFGQCTLISQVIWWQRVNAHIQWWLLLCCCVWQRRARDTIWRRTCLRCRGYHGEYGGTCTWSSQNYCWTKSTIDCFRYLDSQSWASYAYTGSYAWSYCKSESR